MRSSCRVSTTMTDLGVPTVDPEHSKRWCQQHLASNSSDRTCTATLKYAPTTAPAMFRNRRNSRQVRAGCGFCGSHQLQLCQRRSCALGGSPHSLQAVVQAGNMARFQLARFGTCECNGRAGALSGPETAPSGSGGSVRCPRATVGSASALGTVCVASNGRRHAHIAPFGYRKKTYVTDV